MFPQLCRRELRMKLVTNFPDYLNPNSLRISNKQYILYIINSLYFQHSNWITQCNFNLDFSPIHIFLPKHCQTTEFTQTYLNISNFLKTTVIISIIMCILPMGRKTTSYLKDSYLIILDKKIICRPQFLEL